MGGGGWVVFMRVGWLGACLFRDWEEGVVGAFGSAISPFGWGGFV